MHWLSLSLSYYEIDSANYHFKLITPVNLFCEAQTKFMGRV